MSDMKDKPKLNREGMRDLDRAQEQLDHINDPLKDVLSNRSDAASYQESEPQVKMSTREAQSVKEVYLKPTKAQASREKFNEKYRKQYEFMKVYVPFIAEHNEMRGEAIEMWTKPFAGMPAEFWVVPTNVPIWGPRYLAEEIRKKSYHRMTMDNKITESIGGTTFYGQMARDQTIQRLDARPVGTKRSIFMGADGA